MDSAGRSLDRARVILQGTSVLSHTDSTGRFTLERVPVGSRVVRVAKLGFKVLIDTVRVDSGSTLRRRYVLAMQHLPLSHTLPPRVPRGEAIDTVPEFAEAIDPVARVARLPRMRPIAEQRSQRELRLWKGFGIAIPMQLLRVMVQDGRVSGELWHWADATMPRPLDRAVGIPDVDRIPTWLRREFGCGTVMADTVRGRYGSDDEVVFACRVRLPASFDWSAVLRALETHDVWTLPDESEVPQSGGIVNDGVGLVVEAWNGRRYRSYHYGNPDLQPSAEAKHAQTMLELIRDISARGRQVAR